jgi:hypothetical protein
MALLLQHVSAMDHSLKSELDAPTLVKVSRTSSIAEIRDPDELWLGLANPVTRRRIQNRLHQRAWRKWTAALLFGFGRGLDI